MTLKPMASYALAKVVAILKAHADNGTDTDVNELATALQADIPGMSIGDLVELIENTRAVLKNRSSERATAQLN